MDDHAAHEKVFAAMEKEFAKPAGPSPAAVGRMLEYFTVYLDGCHNRKEEEHLFPLVEKRGIPRHGGPLAVMLVEHERSRALLAEIVPQARAYAGGDRSDAAALARRVRDYASLLSEHFWKENDILYPMAQRVMTPDDERAVVAGIEAVEASVGPGTRERFLAMADGIADEAQLKNLVHGLPLDLLGTVLDTLPVELSFVDADDTVRYFSHENKDKIFPRNRGVIGTKVQNCHPPASVHLVNRILTEMKSGKRDVAEFWIDFKGGKIHIRYFAVRDRGVYRGCLEVVQDVAAIQKLQGQRRLLDL